MADLEEIRKRKDKRDQEIEQMDQITSESAKENCDSEEIAEAFKRTPIMKQEEKPAQTSNSVKALRDRWELSSATGTPLHPGNEDILQAAVKLSQQRRIPTIRRKPVQNNVTDNSKTTVNTPTRRFEKEDLRHVITSPCGVQQIERVTAKSPATKTVRILSPAEHFPRSPSQEIELTPESSDDISLPVATSPPVTISTSLAASPEKVDLGKAVTDDFRPITPNDQVIGSLWDDIKAEMEKYKLAKHCQSDPNLSPRSHYDGSLLEQGLSISAYRNMQKRAEPLPIVKETGKFSSSLDSALPEKRQRGNEIGAGESANGQERMLGDAVDGDSSSSGTASKQNCAQNITSEQESILKRLHETIIVQQDQICQASRALAFCRQTGRYRGSKEEVAAQRALLISTECRRALLSERDNVIKGRYWPSVDEPKGTLTISSISFKLSHEYVNNFIQHNSTSLYYFIVLIRSGEHVYHTSLESSDHGIKTGSIEYSHLITIPKLTPDFTCHVEIYSLKCARDSTGTSDKSGSGKQGTWRRMVISTPLNAYSHTFSQTLPNPASASYSASSSAHRPIGVMDPGFQRAGHVTLNRQLVQRRKFLLTDSAYPLEGSVTLGLDCHQDPNEVPLREYRSFLSLYQIVSGLGSWTRFWCALGGGQLRFWRHPEDELNKAACVTLELCKCVSQVSAVPPSTASFPNSMQVDVVLVDPNTAQREGIRMLFAADTPEERESWIECINQAIRKSNVWRMMRTK